MSERLEIKAALTVDDTGEITGIAWPFGSPDRVGDVIEKGAITGPATLPMLFAHDQSQVIGVWDSITETANGLTVKGRLLVDDVERAREVRAMIRSKAVTGLSIGFVTKASKPRQRGRTITALNLHEISVVAVPSHPGAQITSIKAADGTANHKENHMEDELENAPVANADPVIEKKDFDALKARLDKIEAKANRPVAANDNHRAADNDNDERKAFIEFARKGIERMDQKAAATLTVATDASAGYLAPEAFGAEILKSITEFSPVRSYARVMSIVSPEIKLPRKLTGTAATWVSETDDRTQSDMTFEQATFTPYELATYVDVSHQLLEDNAYNLEGELATDLGEAFGKTEAGAFVSGNGTGKPKGLLVATGIAEVKTGNAATLGTDPAATIIGMFHSVPSIVAQNGVWLMNRKTLGSLRTLKDGTGRFIMLDPITAGAPVTLLGRPIVEMVDMPDVAANAYPIMFGDLQGYRIIDRVGLSVLRDPYSQATKGTVRFHARKRVGGDVTNPDRFLKLKVAA
ncbi:phage major capsid protein [Mesorhizobium sp. B2-2-4]|uniref:phage major capsid protein n=1 Tax=unclassified Mesorhizobium TaxID=325217 RepID=UPI00112682F6|nr:MULTISPECIES: phage major capsid protein [unclassified Mesorhizobium]TPM61096.1 phage major capsid protein [Mesorhizobium sp. B2-2-4]TPM70528.1 phage major capsid protein [Mesorhizobium sp. B2-2-1]TPN70380.1 phage major capsid protein [Mesorhizobium sp. B1-1-3]